MATRRGSRIFPFPHEPWFRLRKGVTADVSDQRGDLRRDRDLEDGGDVLGPRRGHGLLDRVQIVEVGRVAAVPLGDRHVVKSGKIEAGNAGCLLDDGEGFEDRVLVVAEDHDQDREVQLRGIPD